MLRGEYSCTQHILGLFCQGISELGDLKVKKYFEIFPMLLKAGFKTSRFPRRYISTESERLDGFRRAIAYWKRIVRG